MSGDRVLTRPFVLCALANFAQALAFNLFLHFPGYLKDLGAGEVQIGFIFGITAIASIAVRPAVGRAMDARGRRSVFLLGGVIHVAVCGLYMTVDAIGPWVYAVRLVHGFAQALLFTSLFTYAADLVPASRRTEGLALFSVSSMLPISVAGVLGDAILERGDFDDLFLWAWGLAVVSLVLCLPLREGSRALGPTPASGGFAATLRRRDLVPLWWMGLIFAVALATVFTFLKTFVMETGLGTLGGFFSAYTAAALVLRVFFGWLPDRVGPKRVLFPALGALVVGLAALAGADTPRALFVAGILCGLGHGFTFPILFGMVVSRVTEEARGSAMSIYTALFDAGMLIGGPSFGLVHQIGGYPALFGSAALLVAGGAVVFAVTDRGR